MVKGISWLILQIEMGHLWGWGTRVIGHMANGAHGQLDLTGGTYLCLEYLPWQGGYLPLQMGTYLGWGDTLVRGYLPWLGEVPTFLEGYLHWPWGYLSGGSTYPERGYLPQLGYLPLLG